MRAQRINKFPKWLTHWTHPPQCAGLRQQWFNRGSKEHLSTVLKPDVPQERMHSWNSFFLPSNVSAVFQICTGLLEWASANSVLKSSASDGTFGSTKRGSTRSSFALPSLRPFTTVPLGELRTHYQTHCYSWGEIDCWFCTSCSGRFIQFSLFSCSTLWSQPWMLISVGFRYAHVHLLV